MSTHTYTPEHQFLRTGEAIEKMDGQGGRKECLVPDMYRIPWNVQYGECVSVCVSVSMPFINYIYQCDATINQSPFRWVSRQSSSDMTCDKGWNGKKRRWQQRKTDLPLIVNSKVDSSATKVERMHTIKMISLVMLTGKPNRRHLESNRDNSPEIDWNERLIINNMIAFIWYECLPFRLSRGNDDNMYLCSKITQIRSKLCLPFSLQSSEKRHKEISCKQMQTLAKNSDRKI